LEKEPDPAFHHEFVYKEDERRWLKNKKAKPGPPDQQSLIQANQIEEKR
jgi:hypothetical protein